MLGSDAHARVELIVPGADDHANSNSSVLLLRELERIANERPANSSVVLEGRADPGTADPPS